jgi:hypothetical protein
MSQNGRQTSRAGSAFDHTGTLANVQSEKDETRILGEHDLRFPFDSPAEFMDGRRQKAELPPKMGRYALSKGLPKDIVMPDDAEPCILSGAFLKLNEKGISPFR